MKAAQTGGPDYDARIHRAGHLAAAHHFAAEVLTFYERLANNGLSPTVQHTTYEYVGRPTTPTFGLLQNEAT